MDNLFKLSPSELTFLWDECQRCFYLKVVKGFNRPTTAFPKIFNKLDKLMKSLYEGKSTHDLSPQLPDGRVIYNEKWVTSQPINSKIQLKGCYIKGKFDTVVGFSQGGYGVVDFKTSEPNPAHIPFYSRQLLAYAYALEHPAAGSLALQPVTHLGLLCFDPNEMSWLEHQKVITTGDVSWLEIPKDEQFFLGFIEQVLEVLNSPHPPAAAPSCPFCQYRDAGREFGL